MWTRVSDFDRMFGAMDLLRSRMNRVFGDFDRSYGNDYGWVVTEGTPRTNLYDAGDHFEIMAEVPGMTKDDLNLRIQGNYLEIRGTRKADAPEGYKVHRVERGAASFTRSFTLPADVDPEKVGASLKDGILTLTLPKAEAAKPKQITIN
ncbi:MAG: Hsp20/alpha crystallin family protein [Proteobacteria bacterium]|nr:Hsp20/alpha crystallin family protein [Pseudomonadota bacterium]MBU4295188.1 Hsp20/alpha crystallin family protein [Pseudomonadota bacterium]MCG2749030.1 Hsp20/alpha crystallin family protein [Desulfobulbaceae bacterium]